MNNETDVFKFHISIFLTFEITKGEHSFNQYVVLKLDADGIDFIKEIPKFKEQCNEYLSWYYGSSPDNEDEPDGQWNEDDRRYYYQNGILSGRIIELHLIPFEREEDLQRLGINIVDQTTSEGPKVTIDHPKDLQC